MIKKVIFKIKTILNSCIRHALMKLKKTRI